jgi:hypothetical protein
LVCFFEVLAQFPLVKIVVSCPMASLQMGFGNKEERIVPSLLLYHFPARENELVSNVLKGVILQYLDRLFLLGCLGFFGFCGVSSVRAIRFEENGSGRQNWMLALYTRGGSIVRKRLLFLLRQLEISPPRMTVVVPRLRVSCSHRVAESCHCSCCTGRVVLPPLFYACPT